MSPATGGGRGEREKGEREKGEREKGEREKGERENTEAAFYGSSLFHKDQIRTYTKTLKI